jgi:hypothetical protein
MNYERTFRIDRLYHQFLQKRNVSIEFLNELILKLEEHNFIKLLDGRQRYIELDKLTNRQNRDELFKLVHKIGVSEKNAS